MQNNYQQVNNVYSLPKLPTVGRKFLTKREHQVLELISHGNSTKDICSQLFLSKSTIESHRYNLLHKMQCKNVAQLIRRGFELGLLKVNS